MLKMKNTTTNNTQELSKKEKQVAQHKAWREANKEKLRVQQLARSKRWREKNKSKDKEHQKAWRDKNKEYIATKSKERYLQQTKAQISERSKNWVEKNYERALEHAKLSYHKNKETRNKRAREYRKENRDKLKRSRLKAQQARYKNLTGLDLIKYKLRATVRNSFRRIKQQKPTNTEKLLGCTWEEAKAHIESLFKEGMTWENYGTWGWHVDHIKPVSSFGPNELHKMNHITNLQPLWREENIAKSNMYQE